MKTYRVIVTIDHINAEDDLHACDKVGQAIKEVQIDGYARSDMRLRAIEGTATEIQEQEIEALAERLKVYEQALKGVPR